MKYITRMDYGSSHGYWVRIRLFYYKINISKLFSDGVWGSPTKAFKAAKGFRDKAIAELKASGKPVGRVSKTFHMTLTKKNRSGSKIVGVHSQIRRGHKYWVGTFYPKKYALASKTFAVNVYGEQGAFERACAFRQKGLKIAQARKGK